MKKTTVPDATPLFNKKNIKNLLIDLAFQFYPHAPMALDFEDYKRVFGAIPLTVKSNLTHQDLTADSFVKIDDKQLAKLNEDLSYIVNVFIMLFKQNMGNIDRPALKNFLGKYTNRFDLVYNSLSYKPNFKQTEEAFLRSTYQHTMLACEEGMNKSGFHTAIEKFCTENKLTADGLNILSVGCGLGEELYTLAKHYPGATYTGVDNNPDISEDLPEAYKHCVSNKFKKEPNVMIADVSMLGEIFKNREINVVIIRNPLVHVKKPNKSFVTFLKGILQHIVSTKGAVIYLSSYYETTHRHALSLLNIPSVEPTLSEQEVLTTELMLLPDKLVYTGHYNPLHLFNISIQSYLMGNNEAVIEKMSEFVYLQENCTDGHSLADHNAYRILGCSELKHGFKIKCPIMLNSAIQHLQKSQVLLEAVHDLKNKEKTQSILAESLEQAQKALSLVDEKRSSTYEPGFLSSPFKHYHLAKKSYLDQNFVIAQDAITTFITLYKDPVTLPRDAYFILGASEYEYSQQTKDLDMLKSAVKHLFKAMENELMYETKNSISLLIKKCVKLIAEYELEMAPLDGLQMN